MDSDAFTVELVSIPANTTVSAVATAWKVTHPPVTLYRATWFQNIYRHLLRHNWHYAGMGLWQRRK